MEKFADDIHSLQSVAGSLSKSPVRRWKPISFKRPVLISVTIVTSLLLAITVTLHLIDHQYGALFVAAPGQELSILNLFLIRYLPIIVLVTYGIWISTLDLDVKRLEPWFWLSSQSRESTETPLLCRYDTNFVLTVLVGSVRKGHWVVFNSSVLALIATAIVPAVQNSMFTTRSQQISHPLLLSNAAGLTNIDTQKFRMTSTLLLSAYSTAWLGQGPPAFSTNQYALGPFSVKNVSDPTLGLTSPNATVHGSTRRYWSELSCWAPSSIELNLSTSTVNFDDGRGCVAKDLLSFNASVTDLYDQGAKYEAYEYGLGSFGGNAFLPSLISQCPDNPHLMLATWRSAGSQIPNFAEGGNATAIFCQAGYYSEPVEAVVRVADFGVLAYTPTGPRSEITDNTFNRTHFEYIISSGSPPSDTTYNNLTALVDVADVMYVEQSNRIANMSVVTPTQQSKDVMIGFALGVTQFPAETYLDMNRLYTAYTRAHQLLFVHALQGIFDNNIASSNSSVVNRSAGISNQNGVLMTEQETIRLVIGFTFATEAFLLFLCALCIYLLTAIPRRPLALCRNPDTLAEIMNLSRSPEMQAIFARLALASESHLEDRLKGLTIHLAHDDKGPLLLPRSNEQNASIDNRPSIGVENLSPPAQQSKHSLELSWTVAGLVGCLLFGSAALLIALDIMAQRRDGLNMFRSSETVQQFVLNLLPTAAATLLGIYLVLLCRVYSFINPMHDLYLGNATAKTTLLVNYTSMSPQLLLAKAYSSKHYLLAALSLAALLSNVLTVTTASMFTLQQSNIQSDIRLSSSLEPIVIDHTSPAIADLGDVTGSSTMDPIYPNSVNMSEGVALPSWTSTEYGFLPVDLNPAARLKASGYGLQSTGYGADLKCSNLLESNSEYSGGIDFQNNGTTFKVWANFSQPNSDTIACVFDLEYQNQLSRLNLAKLSSTVSALEISYYMSRWNGSILLQDGYCASQIIKGWLRAKTTSDASQAGLFGMDYNATIILCQPRLRTQLHSLNITTDGEIVSSQAVAPASYDLPQSVNLSSTFRVAINSIRDFYTLPQWHNDTIARDWSNYLFMEYIGSRDWLNASVQPPTIEEASPVVSNIFSRIFAVQLSLDRQKMRLVDSTSLNAAKRSINTTTMTDSTVTVTATIPTQKLFMSRVNLIISLLIIIFDLIVLIAFRLSLPKPFLPRMPFTIASQIAFFSGSHVIDDVVKAGGDLKRLDEQGCRYAYGKYIGKDGWLHTGIEREQFVTRLSE